MATLTLASATFIALAPHPQAMSDEVKKNLPNPISSMPEEFIIYFSSGKGLGHFPRLEGSCGLL